MKIRQWIAIAAVLLLCGCGAQQDDGASGTGPIRLTVFCDHVPVNGDALQRVYNDRFPEENVWLELVKMPRDEAEREALLTRTRTELMNGGGPDVLVMAIPGSENPFALLPDPEKSLRAGAFLDVLPYLEQLDAWQPEAYQPAVLAAGMRDGGLYLLPLFYDIPLVQASVDSPPAADAPIWQADRCGEWPAWSAAQRPAGLRYLSASADDVWYALDMPLLDYDAGRANFEDPGVRRAARLIWDLAGEQGYLPADQPARAERAGRYVLDRVEESGLEEWDLRPLRSESGGVNATVTMAAAVSAGCEHPRQAAQLLTILLEPEVQAHVPSSWTYAGDAVASATVVYENFNHFFPLRTDAIALWNDRGGNRVYSRTLLDQCTAAAGQVTAARIQNLCAYEARLELWAAHEAGLTFEQAMDELDARWTRYASE